MKISQKNPGTVRVNSKPIRKFALGTGHKVCVLRGGGGGEGWGGETNYLTFGGMRRITTFGGAWYETKNESNTMSMINKTTYIKIECMFLNKCS